MICKCRLIILVTLNLLILAGSASAGDSIVTPKSGVKVSSGGITLELSPVIVTNEFDGEETTSSSTVILVFPYVLHDISEGKIPRTVSADFIDKNGNNLRLPTKSFYSKSISSSYFRTFGDRSLFNKGVSVVPLIIGGAQFPEVKVVLGTQVRTKNTVLEIQTELARLGYNAGVADGIMGSKTKSAIQAYQKNKKMHEDGKATEKLLDILKRDNGL